MDSLCYYYYLALYFIEELLEGELFNKSPTFEASA